MYDIIVVGSGPGGYVAAIRASQLGFKTAVIEREALGGICLNWGCIPTKALLKSAQVFDYIKHAKDYGITVGDATANFEAMIARSRGVATKMSGGIQFLMKKNKIDVIMGHGTLVKPNQVEVKASDGSQKTVEGKHIIIATGATARAMPNLPIDGTKIIEYRKAMSLPTQPKSIVVVGAGAIGIEFAYFYNSIGTKVTVVEYADAILPREDSDVSKEAKRALEKQGITIKIGTGVETVDTSGEGCLVTMKNKATGALEVMPCEVVLSATGITPNTENIGLETLGIKTERGFIVVDEFYRTNVAGVYAIGDVIPTAALAHVASAEGITCVEKIKGHDVETIDYNNIPSCTYCTPEVASVGYTEAAAKAAGFEVKIGKFPFSASGKATASGSNSGFVKVIFDAKYGEFLGAHLIGTNVTELIAEVVVARKLETTGHEIIKSIHPHPTLSEALMEAAAAAYGEVIHI